MEKKQENKTVKNLELEILELESKLAPSGLIDKHGNPIPDSGTEGAEC